jgi:DNA processing protein
MVVYTVILLWFKFYQRKIYKICAVQIASFIFEVLENYNTDILYQIALLEIDRVGSAVSRKLIEHFGSAEQIFKAKKKEILAVGAIGESLWNGISDASNLSFAEAQLKFSENEHTEIISFYDEHYPHRLKQISDAPLVLYQKGNCNLNHSKMVAIVGTRQATDYGKEFCISLLEELKSYNAYVVSGLAFGIDYCAHYNAVQNDIHNIAVLGHGLDRVYPSEHKKLSDEIVGKGALLTEFPIHTNPDRENFPKRNRIVAGMVDAIVVVESAIKGGSMITAKLGNDFNRDVFALPGRNTDEQSLGCNHLIKTNQAHLIERTKDIGYLLGWEKALQEKPKAIQKQLFLNLAPGDQLLVDIIQNGEKSIDEIALLADLPISKVSSQLLMLEFQGIVKQLPGKIYQLG